MRIEKFEQVATASLPTLEREIVRYDFFYRTNSLSVRQEALLNRMKEEREIRNLRAERGKTLSLQEELRARFSFWERRLKEVKAKKSRADPTYISEEERYVRGKIREVKDLIIREFMRSQKEGK